MRDAVWYVDSGGSQEPSIRWDPHPPTERGTSGGNMSMLTAGILKRIRYGPQTDNVLNLSARTVHERGR